MYYFGRVVLCSASLFLALGCEGPDTVPLQKESLAHDTLNQPVVFDNASIGEGLYVLTRPVSNTEPRYAGEMTGEVCVSLDEGVTEIPPEVGFSAFTVFDDVYIDARFHKHLEGGVEYDAYEPQILQHYEGFFDNGEREVVTVLATIPTSSQFLPELPSVDPESACAQGGEATESLEAFFSRCGQRFLREQQRAVVVVLSADITGLTHEKKVLLDRILSVNLDGQEEDLDTAMVRMNLDLPNVHFRVSALTPQTNPTQPLGPNSSLKLNGKLPSANWPQYCDQLRGYYISPFTGEVVDPSFGEVVMQKFEDYSPAFFKACEHELPGNALCYYNYVRNVQDFYGASNRYLRLSDEIYWLLTHDDRVKWVPSRPMNDPNGALSEENTKERYSEFSTTLALCNVNILTEGNMDTCHQAFLSGEQLCTAGQGDYCSVSSCNTQLLEYHYNQLPPARILPEPTPNPVTQEAQITQDEPALGSDGAENLCVLSSVSGYFAGSGESASLTFQNSEWLLSLASQRSEASEHVVAGQFCVPVDYFTDTTAFTSFAQESIEDDTTSSVFQSIGHRRYAAAVNGLEGTLQGGGEYVQTLRPANGGHSEMRLATQQGHIRGWASVFGTENPVNDTAQLSQNPLNSATYWEVQTDTTGHVETILAPVDEGVCYLTKIQGKFTGGGERVSISQVERNWVLSVNAGCEKRKGIRKGGDCKEWKDVRAAARCYKYDQQ